MQLDLSAKKAAIICKTCKDLGTTPEDLLVEIVQQKLKAKIARLDAINLDKLPAPPDFAPEPNYQRN